MERNEVTLAPCPFCGSAARRSLAQPKNGPNSYAIGCSKCIIATEWVETEAEAIAAWNTRSTSLAAQDGLVEALQAIEQTLLSRSV